jgi:hypothetical protein
MSFTGLLEKWIYALIFEKVLLKDLRLETRLNCAVNTSVIDKEAKKTEKRSNKLRVLFKKIWKGVVHIYWLNCDSNKQKGRWISVISYYFLENISNST